MHMIYKGQMQGVAKGDIPGQVTLIACLFGLAAQVQQEGRASWPLAFLCEFLQHNPIIFLSNLASLDELAFAHQIEQIVFANFKN